MEICRDLPTVLNIKQWHCDEERLHLPRAERKHITTTISMLQLQKLANTLTELLLITLVVGPSSFSATQLCRLNARSLHFTRIRFPNFSSNDLISGSIPEKSNFCMQTDSDILRRQHTHSKRLILERLLPSCQTILFAYREFFTCVSASNVKSFSRVSFLILDSMSLALWRKAHSMYQHTLDFLVMFSLKT